jgi:LytR cell envelope-related transcriptional attenuator
MGRHSSPDQGHFYKSFAGWIALWAVIAAVTGVAVWFIVGALGGPEAQKPIAAERDRAESEGSPSPKVSGARVASTPAPSPSPTSTPTTDAEPDEGKLITDGISIQVLNGTADPAAADAMAERLTDLGFSVVAVEESSERYPETTVFWSTAASQDAAVALAESEGWIAEAKPGNLSASVSLHVVVGADEL